MSLLAVCFQDDPLSPVPAFVTICLPTWKSQQLGLMVQLNFTEEETGSGRLSDPPKFMSAVNAGDRIRTQICLIPPHQAQVFLLKKAKPKMSQHTG